jgi:hypothetical protein
MDFHCNIKGLDNQSLSEFGEEANRYWEINHLVFLKNVIIF